MPLAQAGADGTPEAGGNRFEPVMKRARRLGEGSRG
jgi:hypothetical protein